MFWTPYIDAIADAIGSVDEAQLDALATHLLSVWRHRRTVFVCGNGGSANTANHLAQDLSKGTIFDPDAPRLRAISLCANVGALTAWANDEGYENAFAQQLQTLGREGDVLIAISGSGNSENVLLAVAQAHYLGMRTWGITGYDGGKLRHAADRCVHVETPCSDTGMGVAEAVHGVIFHWLIDYLKGAMAAHYTQGLSIVDSPAPVTFNLYDCKTLPDLKVLADKEESFTINGQPLKLGTISPRSFAVYVGEQRLGTLTWTNFDINHKHWGIINPGGRVERFEYVSEALDAILAHGAGAWCPGVEDVR